MWQESKASFEMEDFYRKIIELNNPKVLYFGYLFKHQIAHTLNIV